MIYAGKRTRMHAFVLISLLSALAAGMLAGAIWARDPGNRGNRLAAALLSCAAFWSLCNVFANLAGDPHTALAFLRAACIGSLMIAPLAFHMLLVLEPALAPRLGRCLGFSYASAVVFIALAVATPAWWSAVRPAPWGVSGVMGLGVTISWLILVPFPVAALIGWLRLRDDSEKLDTWLGVAVAIPAAVASVTDFILPYAEIQFPPLGSVGVVVWGGIALWKVYRFRDPNLAPHLFAREILTTLPDGVALLRLEGTIRSANGKFAGLVGTSVGDLTGRPIAEILVDLDATTKRFYDDHERLLVRADAERISVLVDEAPLYDDDGDCLGKVLVVRDLREVASLRNRLVTSGRLVAVGQLAAGIAHEINNPVAYVQSNLNLLEDHWEAVGSELTKDAPDRRHAALLDEGRDLIHESRDGLQRIAAIVRDVGGFSQPTHPEQESSDLNELLDTALRVAHPQLQSRAEIERSYNELPLVRCIPQELMQVFLNLLLNAAYAVDPMGRIRLETEPCGDWIEVRLIDDGKGMGEETLSQIFTPFFTTKPVGEGTGLGLPISRQIIEKHGGTIDVTSTPGEGTTFCIRLPAGIGAGRDDAEIATA